jgi:hypothetical protein
VIAASAVAMAAPAQATQFDAKELTCTSSTGYNTIVRGKAQGYITHSLDQGAQVWEKGTYGYLATLSTKTGYSGTHYAEVQGIDRPGIVGKVSLNSSYCGTT